MKTRGGRFAAIDIGTVTCRLLVADVDADGRLTELHKDMHITNLGVGVDRTGVLEAEAIARVSAVVAEYRRIIDSLTLPGQTIPVIANATSASRDAANADVLVAELAKSQVRLSVIPGEREAALSFKGASGAYPGEHLMVADVGGGSTEVIFGIGCQEPGFRYSFDVGARRITERFLHSDPPTPDEIAQARSWIRQTMQPVFDQAWEQGCTCERMVAVAGTATTMVAIEKEMAVYDSAQVDGAVITAETLSRQTAQLASLPLEQRQAIIGLEPKRAAVIVGGALVLETVLSLAGVAAYTASESDILQGIILDAAGC